MGQEKQPSGKKSKTLIRSSILILVLIIAILIYIIIADPWNLSKAPYGAGDYYYTDVEGFDFSVNIGTKHPIIFFTLFFGWAFACWYFLKWLESKK
ncbi:MAG: hypothetical protein PWQ67_728 [Clostridia bacterium]|jgi:hypothetical protein|nr:hypothetical protein [Clostridia bacterium]MDN5322274.1 hypothetical protein [Clostridia bacterium]